MAVIYTTVFQPIHFFLLYHLMYSRFLLVYFFIYVFFFSGGSYIFLLFVIKLISLLMHVSSF